MLQIIPILMMRNAHIFLRTPHARISLHSCAAADTRNTPRQAPAIVSDTLQQGHTTMD